MDFHLQNEPLSKGALRRGEKVNDCGPPQGRINKHGRQNAVTFNVVPSTRTWQWLESRHGSHLLILSETWPSHFGAICTFTLFPLEMWLFHHSFCTWKSDSQCFPSFSLGESVSSFSLSLPLELASAGTSSLLNPPLALKYNYHFLLDFFSSKCNLKTLEKQKLYRILPRVPKN